MSNHYQSNLTYPTALHNNAFIPWESIVMCLLSRYICSHARYTKGGEFLKECTQWIFELPLSSRSTRPSRPKCLPTLAVDRLPFLQSDLRIFQFLYLLSRADDSPVVNNFISAGTQLLQAIRITRASRQELISVSGGTRSLSLGWTLVNLRRWSALVDTHAARGVLKPLAMAFMSLENREEFLQDCCCVIIVLRAGKDASCEEKNN